MVPPVSEALETLKGYIGADWGAIGHAAAFGGGLSQLYDTSGSLKYATSKSTSKRHTPSEGLGYLIAPIQEPPLAAKDLYLEAPASVAKNCSQWLAFYYSILLVSLVFHSSRPSSTSLYCTLFCSIAFHSIVSQVVLHPIALYYLYTLLSARQFHEPWSKLSGLYRNSRGSLLKGY